MNIRPRAWLAAVAGTALLLAPVSAASAQDRDPHQDLTDSYTSLSGSLIGFYAATSGQTLTSYLQTQQLLLQPATMPDPVLDDLTDPSGTSGDLGEFTPDADATPSPAGAAAADEFDFSALDVPALSSSGGKLLTSADAGRLSEDVRGVNAKDLQSLNAELDKAGVSFNAAKYTSLSQLATAITRSARTPDGAVTLASAKWIKQLESLRDPKVTGAKATNPTMPGVPADALPYGLLMNESLANLVTDHPNLVLQAQKNAGLGSKALQEAWNASMAQAYKNSGKSLTSLLPNPCVGEMMGVMATGKKKSSSGCAPACSIAGQYLHYQAGAAFNPQQNSMVPNMSNPAGGVLNNSSLTQMNQWAQQLIVSQNPQLTGPSEMAAPGTSVTECTTASTSAKNTLGNKLPGMFGNLK